MPANNSTNRARLKAAALVDGLTDAQATAQAIRELALGNGAIKLATPRGSVATSRPVAPCLDRYKSLIQ